jgi:hypothetical protein
VVVEIKKICIRENMSHILILPRYFCIGSDGIRRGPYAADEIRQLFVVGEISTTSMISSSENERLWVPLSESPLFVHMPRPPSDAPPARSSADIKTIRLSMAARKSMKLASSSRSGRTASQKFLRAPLLDASQYLWFEDEEGEQGDGRREGGRSNQIWSLCSVISQDNTILELQNLENSHIFTIDMGFTDVMKYNDSIVSDMAMLTHIHEPGVMYNMFQRYSSGQPHTFIGPILLTINPLKSQKHPVITAGVAIPNTPHPYVLAGIFLQLFSFVFNIMLCICRVVYKSGATGVSWRTPERVTLWSYQERVAR